MTTKAQKTKHQLTFDEIAESFTGDGDVTFKQGKGFGSNALKVHGKIFAMVSSKGHLTVKLSAPRAAYIVDQGRGHYFDPGHGRIMKQWVEIRNAEDDWAAIILEARNFVGGS